MINYKFKCEFPRIFNEHLVSCFLIYKNIALDEFIRPIFIWGPLQ